MSTLNNTNSNKVENNINLSSSSKENSNLNPIDNSNNLYKEDLDLNQINSPILRAIIDDVLYIKNLRKLLNPQKINLQNYHQKML